MTRFMCNGKMERKESCVKQEKRRGACVVREGIACSLKARLINKELTFPIGALYDHLKVDL
jgi:hypothetical protein